MNNEVFSMRLPQESRRLAQALQQHTGLSLSDVLRLALASGLLVESTKVGVMDDGTCCGLEPQALARSLRRHLASAIDLLLEYGQHPTQGPVPAGRGMRQRLEETRQAIQATPSTSQPFSLAHDLEQLGMGFGLSEG
jgi:hypothetical protein